jgi:hypothetical protein
VCCSVVLLALGFLAVRAEAAAAEPMLGAVGRGGAPACGWWHLVSISGDSVPAEVEDVGAAASGVRAFSSLLRRERV